MVRTTLSEKKQMKKNTALKTFLATLVLTLSPGLQAAITQTQIEQFIMDIWRVQADFHMYTVMSGADEYSEQMDDSISRGQKTLSNMRSEAETDKGNALVSELEQTWSEFASHARANEAAEQGVPSRYTLKDLEATSKSMRERLKNADFAESGEYADIMGLGGELQSIAAEYLRLAADPAGGMASGSGSRITFEEAVPAFEERLNTLQKKYSDEDAIKRTLSQVQLRWRFIRESLINFSEDSVPFLIHRYSHQMTDELELAKNLATGSGAQQPMQGGAPTPGQGEGEGQGGG